MGCPSPKNTPLTSSSLVVPEETPDQSANAGKQRDDRDEVQRIELALDVRTLFKSCDARVEAHQRLFEAANEPKQFVEINGGHNDGFSVSREYYQGEIDKFLSRHVRE